MLPRCCARVCLCPTQPNGCIVTVPPGSSRDLTAGDAHPGVPCRSSHCSPAPGWTGARRGCSLSTRASRVSPAPLSSAELLSPWFPTLLLPPTTPWPYYGPTGEGDERLAIFPNIISPSCTKVFFQEMLKEIFGKSFPRPRGSLTRPLPSPPASSSSSSSFRKVDPLKCVPPEPTGTLELQGFKPKTSCGTTVTRRTPTSIERWCARPQWEAGEGQVLTWARRPLRCGAVRRSGPRTPERERETLAGRERGRETARREA